MTPKWWAAVAAAAVVGAALARADESQQGRIVLEVPADARVYFDGEATHQTGSERTFDTPALKAGISHYQIRVEVDRRGQTVSRTKRISVQAGQVTRADFSDLGETLDGAAESAAPPVLTIPQYVPSSSSGVYPNSPSPSYPAAGYQNPPYFPPPNGGYQPTYPGFAQGNANGGYANGMQGNTANNSQGGMVHLLVPNGHGGYQPAQYQMNGPAHSPPKKNP